MRRALTLALNRKIITEGILQDATLRQLYGWVPYGIKDIVDPTQDWRDVVGNAFEENVEEAKALLAEAGYPNGEGFPTFSIKYTPSTELEERRPGDGRDVEAVSGSQLRSDRRGERRILGG